MSSELMTVAAAAALLQIHPKTVLRFIRDGRLRASKVGKQYRVLRSDLNALAAGDRSSGAVMARVTSIVDIESVDAALLQRISAVLVGASKGKEPAGARVSLDIAHDPLRSSAKVIVIASPADTAMLLRLLDTCLEA